jgi:hypothetical protein
MGYGKAPWVPHMVQLAEEVGDLKVEVGIPNNAVVYGRHGGDDSFDIPRVQKAGVETARKHPQIWFLFHNTRKFPGATGLPNIRFLPATADPLRKRLFLNRCDAMLHGRMRGKTFGFSCLEFAMIGKPVLTYAGSPERAHLEILGDMAMHYKNAQELHELLRKPTSIIGDINSREWRTEGGEWMEKLKQYQPEAVMWKLDQVFLK